jgi:hypothetical protein
LLRSGEYIASSGIWGSRIPRSTAKSGRRNTSRLKKEIVVAKQGFQKSYVEEKVVNRQPLFPQQKKIPRDKAREILKNVGREGGDK